MQLWAFVKKQENWEAVSETMQSTTSPHREMKEDGKT